MYKALRNGESPSDRPLSGTYVRDISVTLHRMFRDAVKGGDADSNPCEYAEPPAIDTEQRTPPLPSRASGRSSIPSIRGSPWSSRFGRRSGRA